MSSSKFVPVESESVAEIEGLLQMHSQISHSIICSEQDFTNTQQQTLSQTAPSSLPSTSHTNISSNTQTNSQTNIYTNTQPSANNNSQNNNEKPETHRKKGLFSMGKRKYKADTIRKMDNVNNDLEVARTTERSASLEEKIKKRFSIRSNNVIKSLGLSPQFLLYQEIDNMPPIKIQPLTVNRALIQIKGPGDSSQKIMNYGEYSSSISFSNYPKMQGRPYSEGDPICDRFNISLYENRVILSLADGCNWGDLPRKAAKRATKNFNLFVANHYKDITSLRSAGSVILAAFAEADRSIRENMSELGPPPGTTTMIGGILAEVNFSMGNLSPRSVANAARASNWDGSPWVFIFASVGDCKCYHYSLSSKKLQEISSPNSRVDILNATNPGGRLGGNQADLLNFSLSFAPCDEGDILLFLTDGMYDNFDPIQQGKLPSDFGLREEKWEQVECKTLHSLVDNYIVEFIEREMIPEDNPVLASIVTNCANFVKNFTKSSRNFMEQNPKSKLPADLKLYPGKLDHSTCAAIKVGKIGISYNDWVGNSDQKVVANVNRSRNNKQQSVSNSSSSSSVYDDLDTFSEKSEECFDSELIGSYQAIRKLTKMSD